MLLYMAARAQLVEEVIRPALAAGKTVVCDRYLLANVVYQGHAGGLNVADLWQVGRVATGGLMPDLTIVLDLPAAAAAARLDRPLDRMEQQGDAFHARVRQGFLDEAAHNPARIRVIDASRRSTRSKSTSAPPPNFASAKVPGLNEGRSRPFFGSSPVVYDRVAANRLSP